MGVEASGSRLRRGLGAGLHTEAPAGAAATQAHSVEGKCLFTVLPIPFACYLFYFFLGSRCPAIHVQLSLHRPASCGAG